LPRGDASIWNRNRIFGDAIAQNLKVRVLLSLGYGWRHNDRPTKVSPIFGTSTEDQVTPTHPRGRHEPNEAGADRKRGRPSLFRPEYVEQVRRLCAAGFKDEQIAAYFGVNRSTLHRWQTRSPEFFDARANKNSLQPSNPPHQFRLEFVDQVRTLSELGLTNIKIAKLFSIRISTFDRLRREYPAFGEAVSVGRSAAQQPR
jgi:hypothetical protein